MVYRLIRKPESRADIRKLYSVDVEADSFMNDDLEVSLIETSADTSNDGISNVRNHAFLDRSVLYVRTLQDYETSDEES